MESIDKDLLKKEQQEKFTKEDEDNIYEFAGMLQDAFSFGNKNLNEELVFISLEKVFKEYFDGAEIDIKRNYAKRFLKVSK